MTNNEFIACDMCNEIFNLRIQMGNYNIPFNIGCPNCMTKIKGIYHLENDTNNEIELTNAHIYEGSKEDFKGYCVELSAEFPTKKMFYRDLSMENGKLSNVISTPYIRNLKFYNSMESAIDSNKKAMNFADFASICLENFYFITYILELLYTLRKLSYISSGVMLSAENLKSSTPENNKNKRRKIGRNESCPCGSGIKHKKCHGRNKGKINE